MLFEDLQRNKYTKLLTNFFISKRLTRQVIKSIQSLKFIKIQTKS
jgi:hypothetical protein